MFLSLYLQTRPLWISPLSPSSNLVTSRTLLQKMPSKRSLEQGSSAGTEMTLPNPKVRIRHAILEQRGSNGIVRTTYFRMENGVNKILRIKYSSDEKKQDSSPKSGEGSGSRVEPGPDSN
ncbi:hypothetical protein ACET3Z_013938 [Daucus carota]